MARAALPEDRRLVDLYVRQDLTMRQIAVRYGCTVRTVNNRLRAAALGLGLSYPLKSQAKARAARTGSVDARMLRAEIAHCVATYRVTQVQLAQAAGLRANHLHQITAGFRERVSLATARKIQAGIEKVERGEVVGDGRARVPLHVRTTCDNGHPYTGSRDSSTGRRRCSWCRADKERRVARFEQRVARRP